MWWLRRNDQSFNKRMYSDGDNIIIIIIIIIIIGFLV